MNSQPESVGGNSQALTDTITITGVISELQAKASRTRFHTNSCTKKTTKKKNIRTMYIKRKSMAY